MIRLRELVLNKRGDEAKALFGSRSPRNSVRVRRAQASGFSLIELVITISVLTILTFSVVPLLKISVKRQKEQQLRAYLRQMRTAIDEFRRDTVGRQCTVPAAASRHPIREGLIQQVSIWIREAKLLFQIARFSALIIRPLSTRPETLVNGVNVIPRTGAGGRGVAGVNATEAGSELATKKKVYLRGIPIDPMTGEADWDLRSCYDSSDRVRGAARTFSMFVLNQKRQRSMARNTVTGSRQVVRQGAGGGSRSEQAQE